LSHSTLTTYLILLITLLIPPSASAQAELAFFGHNGSNYVRIFTGDADPSQPEQIVGPYDRLASEGQRLKRFRIQNTGDRILRMNFPEISNIAENGFFIRDWPGTIQELVELNPGSSLNFKIGLIPKKQSAISVLTIPYNDAGAGDLVIIINGDANAGKAEFFYSPPEGNNEVLISNGDGTPTPTEGTTFGAVDIGRPSGTDDFLYNPSVTHRFVLRNRATDGDTIITEVPKILDGNGDPSPHWDITNYNSLRATPLSSTSLDIFEITYNPTEEGLHIDTFSVVTNDLENPTYTFTLIGRGVTRSKIVLEGRKDDESTYHQIVNGSTVPSLFNGTILPATSIGATSTHRIRVRSTGSETLEIEGTPTSSNPAFNISAFSSTSIPQHSTRFGGFDINFEPTERGIQFSEISFPTNDPDNPTFTFAVIANGIGPELVIKGTGNDDTVRDIPNSPSTAPNADYGTLLGSVESGAAAITRQFILRNRGTQNSVISNVSMTGTHAADFALTGIDADGQETDTIEPSSEKTLTLTFTPNASGPRTATLQVEHTHNSETSTYQFQVSANVIAPAVGSIRVLGQANIESSFREITSGSSRPSTSNGTLFPETEVGKSATTNFRIANSGKGPLKITKFVIEGDTQRSFQVRPTPSGTLQPETASNFSVRFTPSRAATSTITIVISSDDPKLPTFSFVLSGTSIDPEEDSLPPTRIQSLALDGSEATVTFFAETGKRFAVKTSTNLATGSWTTFEGLEQIDGNDKVQTLLISDFMAPGISPQRFIRLEELE